MSKATDTRATSPIDLDRVTVRDLARAAEALGIVPSGLLAFRDPSVAHHPVAVSIETAAQLTETSGDSIRNAIHRGDLRAVQVDGRLRIATDDLRTWFGTREQVQC